MNANKENLNAFFQQTKGISEQRARFYGGWLNRFLHLNENRSCLIALEIIEYLAFISAVISAPTYPRILSNSV